MMTIGVDYHKRTSTYAVYDAQGHRCARRKLENRPELIKEFLAQWPEPKELAMEATRNWGLMYDFIKDKVDLFHLGHPKKMKVITESETKNDAADADLIARLLQSKFLPEAYVAEPEVRHRRSVLKFRAFLVRQRAALRNQAQVLLDRNLWPCERPTTFKDIFCQRGCRWLAEVRLPRSERAVLDEILYAFDSLSGQIEKLEGQIGECREDWEGLVWLRTVPGFQRGGVQAYTVLAEIADIRRFKKARHLAHYAGLVPSEHSSAEKVRHGRLVKSANFALRTAFIESTLSALRVDRGLKAYFQSVKKNTGSGGDATIACARKLCYAVFHVLKEQRAYRPFPVELKPQNDLPPAAVSSADPAPQG